MKKTIKLSRNIYNINTVLFVVDAFSQICKVKTHEDEQYIICDILESVAEIELTAKEFENYLIGLTRKNDY